MRTLLLLLLGVTLAGTAWAHGESAWIGEQMIKNAKGEMCCGENDCHVIPDENVAVLPSGYVAAFNGEQYPIPLTEAQPSQDGKFHLCIWGGQRKCFFAPPMGS